MAKKINISEADRILTNRIIASTPQEKLVELFGERDSYEISENLNISAISNKATYKLGFDEMYYLNVRETIAYKQLKALYTRNAINQLGFDFNQDFGITKQDKFNLQSLSDFEDNQTDQLKHIPLNQTLINKIVSAQKFKVDVEKSPKSKLEETGRSIEYYLCEVDGQIVPVAIVLRNSEIHNTHPVRYAQSVSVFALLKGKVPFFISRLDFDPFNKHTNRFVDGKITSQKKQTRGTHQHIATEKFAVLVPTQKRIMHADALSYDFLPSFEKAIKFVKAQIHTSPEKNTAYQEVFENDIKKAHKQKKFKSSKQNKYNPHYQDLNF